LRDKGGATQDEIDDALGPNGWIRQMFERDTAKKLAELRAWGVAMLEGVRLCKCRQASAGLCGIVLRH
jgi:hypothetical protein